MKRYQRDLLYLLNAVLALTAAVLIPFVAYRIGADGRARQVRRERLAKELGPAEEPGREVRRKWHPRPLMGVEPELRATAKGLGPMLDPGGGAAGWRTSPLVGDGPRNRE